eukprot:11208927-Lingulodinium_polyedra.AAC.1
MALQAAGWQAFSEGDVTEDESPLQSGRLGQFKRTHIGGWVDYRCKLCDKTESEGRVRSAGRIKH